jgi:hypothetical protein
MGITKMIGKSVKKKPKVMVAAATFEKWEKKPAEDVAEFVNGMIEQVKKDFPLYRYKDSTFDYTHDGNIDFKFRFILKEFRGALSISR